MPDDRKLGQRDAIRTRMLAARHLPRILDSSRPDGGVELLLSNPGGKLSEYRPGRPIGGTPHNLEIGDPGTIKRAPGTWSVVGQLPLLIQFPGELDPDFQTRAALSSLPGKFWHGVEHVAGRPFTHPVTVSGRMPAEMAPGGAWFKDVDGQQTSLRSFLAALTRDSVGYGVEYVHVDIEPTMGNRPILRRVPFESICAVEVGLRHLPGMIEVMGSTEGRCQCWRFYQGTGRAGDGSRVEEGGRGFAWVEIHELKKEGSMEFEEKPSERRSLWPWVEIPIIPYPTGILSDDHFILPPLLNGAKLDHTILNIDSGITNATALAQVPMRFAAGIPQGDIEEWLVVSQATFYATTVEKDKADMKWVTFPPEGVVAGQSVVEGKTRDIEVTMLSPMLTRGPGDERATGQAISAARAQSAAEGYALMWKASASRIWHTMAQAADPSRSSMVLVEAGKPVREAKGKGKKATASPPAVEGEMEGERRAEMAGTADAPDTAVTVEINTDFGFIGKNAESAAMLAKLYSEGRVPPEVFWAQMKRLQEIHEEVEIEELVNSVKSEDERRANREMSISRGQLLLQAVGEGLFKGKANREAVYSALLTLDLGLPKDFDPKRAAADDETEIEADRQATEDELAAAEAAMDKAFDDADAGGAKGKAGPPSSRNPSAGSS